MNNFVTPNQIKATLYECVEANPWCRWTDAQKRNLSTILNVLRREITGQYLSWTSGGGCSHFTVQLRSNYWLLFHGDMSDITKTSKPYQTADEVYNAFWADCGVNTNDMCIDSWDDFSNIERIVSDIRQDNFKSSYA